MINLGGSNTKWVCYVLSEMKSVNLWARNLVNPDNSLSLAAGTFSHNSFPLNLHIPVYDSPTCYVQRKDALPLRLPQLCLTPAHPPLKFAIDPVCPEPDFLLLLPTRAVHLCACRC